jgi:hypothetical protein
MTAIAKAATTLSMLTLLAACAAQPPAPMMGDELALSLQPQIHAVHHESQRSFSVQSTGYIVAAVLLPTPLVFLAASADGDGLKREYGLEDPVARMKQRLVSSLESSLKLTNVTAVSAPLLDDDIETLKRAFENGVVLDVRTVRWGIDNNRGSYSARARLVRLADSSVLWEATCHDLVAGRAGATRTRAALVANNGELLKSELREAADACADQLAGWVSGK